jgi:hypothetical protein
MLISVSLNDFRELLAGVRATAPVERHVVELPLLDGVRLSPTDLIALDAERMLFAAAAEAAPNAYEDGPTVGSCVGVVDAQGRVFELDRIDAPGLKLEGLAISERGSPHKLLAVADQDDPASEGSLFELSFDLS